MKNRDKINYILNNLRRRRLRSWLTIIGITLGIITIYSILSIGDGINESIHKELESFGNDKMFIVPFKLDSGPMINTKNKVMGKLYERDLEEIRKISGVSSVSGGLFYRLPVKYKKKTIQATVYGVEKEMFEQYNNYLELESGRYFRKNERGVVVLGWSAANEDFGKDKIEMNQVIEIGGKKYRVVGILQKVGTTISKTDDSAIYIPLEDMRDTLGDKISKNELSIATIQFKGDEEEIKEEIEERLRSLHKVSEDNQDFDVITPKSMNKLVGDILGIVTVSLLFLAGISAVVGGIGIANTMFTSILERRKEIGILKALGMSNKEIMNIFLIESGLVGGIGGMIGVLVSVVVLILVNKYMGVPIILDPVKAVVLVGFSVIVGMSAGYLPSKSSTEISPVEAMMD